MLAENNPQSKTQVSVGPRLAGDDFARQNFNSLIVGQLRGLTDPKTGELDPGKLEKLPPSVQHGMERAMRAGHDAREKIIASGFSGPAAAAQGHQTFLDSAIADSAVLGHMTDCVLAQSTISPRTRHMAEQVAAQTRAQLAAVPIGPMSPIPGLSGPVTPGGAHA